MFCSFLTLFTHVCSSELNPPPKRNELWTILAVIVCTDPHFKNLLEIVDHPGTFGILFSTYYALGHTYFNLTYSLGWIVWTLGRRDSQNNHTFKEQTWLTCMSVLKLSLSSVMSCVTETCCLIFSVCCYCIFISEHIMACMNRQISRS